ncbi:hypothetical protein BX661DRAFT_176641 [Kickxella alabastrina]|uniref:uncharacterized protein n=1 Tax=Kickxella alabastrina TaxID=61397 RepID=UPI0022207628|nr:uncharacterized protein BX661DRAFT_176641 [Kickxella alabastrina]KAI7834104.1 hypothetical protein BX661DRAFT_176641 [Kickxella alabastrina]
MEYSLLNLKPNTSLLNPHFDGYKLWLVDSDDSDKGAAVQSYPLASADADPRKLATGAHLSFDEMHSRIHYNHLFVGPTDGSFIYIDSENRVNLVDISGQSVRTLAIFDIPQKKSQYALDGYPGAYSLDEETILIFDGLSSAYVLQRQNGLWAALGAFEIGFGSVVAGPSDSADRRNMNYILGAALVGESNQPAIHLHFCYRIDRDIRRKGPPATTTSTKILQPVFCIRAVKVDLRTLVGSLDDDGDAIPQLFALDVHSLHSHAIPVYCEYLGSDHFVLGVRDGVALDGTEAPPQDTMAVAGVPEPYYWTQTDSDVTVCIQLPSSISADQIACSLTRVSLTLEFNNAPDCETKYSFNNTAFHSHIMADESVWTLENGRLLTLYLQKARKGVRWTTVFSTDDGVLETMDSSEFAVIRERLEKYTSENIDMRKLGGGLPIQSAAGAMDQDDDDLEGEDSSVVFSVRNWTTGQADASSAAESPDWLCPSFPRAPASSRNAGQGCALPPVCLKFDVDGVVFAFKPDEARASVEAQHIGTFAALSYIQGSKREKRFMFVDANMSVAVLAETRRRVYIYHQAKSENATNAVQNIVDFGDSELLGIQNTGKTLVVLCSSSLYLVDLNKC